VGGEPFLEDQHLIVRYIYYAALSMKAQKSNSVSQIAWTYSPAETWITFPAENNAQMMKPARDIRAKLTCIFGTAGESRILDKDRND